MDRKQTSATTMTHEDAPAPVSPSSDAGPVARRRPGSLRRAHASTTIATLAIPAFSLVLGAALMLGVGLPRASESSANADSPAPTAADRVDFNADIRPILSNNCFKCHGPDEGKTEGGRRLDTLEHATSPTKKSRRAIVPTKPGESELIKRVSSSDDDERMPPPEMHKTLTPAEIATLSKWIEEGAEYKPHWSLVPPVKTDAPVVKNAAWCRNFIDPFVLARLEKEGLAPSPEADLETLLRRVSLDLTGLPPSPKEIDDFLADAAKNRDGAYERVVDRLLASDAYGERWARVWLDLARFADTRGYEKDDRRVIWPYRDWVIRAFNSDTPFDRFTIAQLAGDLVDNASDDDLIATAFHRNTMNNDEGGTDDEEFRSAAVVDRVNTTMQVWMGVTAGCAQCHSHRYDPVSQREYYGLFALLDQTQDADRPDESPTFMVGSTEDKARLATLEAALRDREAELAACVAKKDDTDAGKAEVERLTKARDVARAETDAQRARLPSIPIMRELPPDQRRTTKIHIKGSFLNQGDPVEPGVPVAYGKLRESEPRNRLGFAHWLVDRSNPLTARVTVNRWWEQFFGVGIVETVEDFGSQAPMPTHPALLDALAVDFMERGWSMKKLCKSIVTSSTYRQSSRARPECMERDARNLLLWRGPRFRLDAEMLRDSALCAAGLLSPKMYGPSVFPRQPDGIWAMPYSGDSWVLSEGEDRFRRAVYTFIRRTAPYPSMMTFDAGSRESCLPRRIRTNTPLQALTTLNDPVYVEAAQGVARRAVGEGGADPSARAAYMIKLCIGRTPRDGEVERIVSLYQGELAHYTGDNDNAIKMATDPLGALPEGMNAPELAAWTVVANVVLNLDETLTKN
jgi:mono/diheme cytochrome c family protein